MNSTKDLSFEIAVNESEIRLQRRRGARRVSETKVKQESERQGYREDSTLSQRKTETLTTAELQKRGRRDCLATELSQERNDRLQQRRDHLIVSREK